MGLFGDLLSTPFKIAGSIIETSGELTGTKKLTNIISKPLDSIGDSIQELDKD